MRTIKELYEWAVSRGAENLPVGLQYQDSGGSYCGDTLQDGETVMAQVDVFGEQKYVLLF